MTAAEVFVFVIGFKELAVLAVGALAMIAVRDMVGRRRGAELAAELDRRHAERMAELDAKMAEVTAARQPPSNEELIERAKRARRISEMLAAGIVDVSRFHVQPSDPPPDEPLPPPPADTVIKGRR